MSACPEPSFRAVGKEEMRRQTLTEANVASRERRGAFVSARSDCWTRYYSSARATRKAAAGTAATSRLKRRGEGWRERAAYVLWCIESGLRPRWAPFSRSEDWEEFTEAVEFLRGERIRDMSPPGTSRPVPRSRAFVEEDVPARAR